jgi:hypothetical protein
MPHKNEKITIEKKQAQNEKNKKNRLREELKKQAYVWDQEKNKNYKAPTNQAMLQEREENKKWRDAKEAEEEFFATGRI